MINFHDIKKQSEISTASVFAQASKIETCAREMEKRFALDGKLLWVGNGGSAAECQHMSAEYMVRYKKNRQPLASISLTADTALMTAHANDFEYESIFSRQINALGLENDILIAISTSGKSPNWLAAIQEARRKGMFIILLTGRHCPVEDSAFDICFHVDSDVTARIQEGHTLINHMVCECVESLVC
jgi:D-sedoheptulose 7-phosphate isomerase